MLVTGNQARRVLGHHVLRSPLYYAAIDLALQDARTVLILGALLATNPCQANRHREALFVDGTFRRKGIGASGDTHTINHLAGAFVALIAHQNPVAFGGFVAAGRC